MTCAGIAKTQGLVLKCTQVHTQQRVAAKGFGQKRSRGGGGAVLAGQRFTARAANCCKKEKHHP